MRAEPRGGRTGGWSRLGGDSPERLAEKPAHTCILSSLGPGLVRGAKLGAWCLRKRWKKVRWAGGLRVMPRRIRDLEIGLRPNH